MGVHFELALQMLQTAMGAAGRCLRHFTIAWAGGQRTFRSYGRSGWWGRYDWGHTASFSWRPSVARAGWLEPALASAGSENTAAEERAGADIAPVAVVAAAANTESAPEGC